MGSNDDQGDGTFSHEQKQEFETLLDQLSGSKDSIKVWNFMRQREPH